MLKPLGVAAASLALLVLLPGSSAYADHLASKKKAPSTSTAAVEGRLVELGMDRDSARHEVGSMTSGELDYYAADPARVQVVAGLTSEEFLVGGGFLGLMLLLTLFLIGNSKGT